MNVVICCCLCLCVLSASAPGLNGLRSGLDGFGVKGSGGGRSRNPWSMKVCPRGGSTKDSGLRSHRWYMPCGALFR